MDDILFQTPHNPFPDSDGGRHIAGHFDSRDGKRLRYAIFKSDISVAKGTVVLLQGRNECIEKYYETIADLNRMGLWVATFDWRGQGGSERLMTSHSAGYVRRFSDYEADLEDFLESIVLPDARLPFFIVAHSTGALVALSAAPRLSNRIDRMVLCAPFIALGDQRLGLGSIGLMTALMTKLGLGRRLVARNRHDQPFKDNRLTHDETRFRRNQAIFGVAPVLSPSSPTARWINEAIRTMRQAREPSHLASIRIPTLILAAGADRIVPIREIEELGSYFRAGRIITIDRARHELFQEKDLYREQALAAIEAFLPGASRPIHGEHGQRDRAVND
ncbi:alpha/beta fold hydrolase [Pararhizobium haloflavum]|uniref:alpha/beta fold hydrolase n=1 Tax=Pararhizobium haloflavum TaxID=2037914 RepID=UPI000C1874E3|nr:alpha/beta hydrolase [Pararhizobium haloflavum]